jgi:hypothetical protein
MAPAVVVVLLPGFESCFVVVEVLVGFVGRL